MLRKLKDMKCSRRISFLILFFVIISFVFLSQHGSVLPRMPWGYAGETPHPLLNVDINVMIVWSVILSLSLQNNTRHVKGSKKNLLSTSHVSLCIWRKVPQLVVMVTEWDNQSNEGVRTGISHNRCGKIQKPPCSVLTKDLYMAALHLSFIPSKIIWQ